MKNNQIWLTLIFGFFLISCSNSNPSENKTNIAKKENEIVIKKTPTVSFIKTFEGSISDKYPITMKLKVIENDVSGSYFYNKVGEFISLKGRAIGDSLKIRGYDKSGNQVDDFDLTFSNGKLSGYWSKPDGSRQANLLAIESNMAYPNKDNSASNSIEQNQSMKDRLCGKLWYSPEDALVAHWKYFSKTGKYREWQNGKPEPEAFTGNWRLDEQNKILTLVNFEFNQSEQFNIKHLDKNELKILSTGVSAGPILYEFKGVPGKID